MKAVAVAAQLFTPPGRECSLCPRLVAFRAANRASWPDWHNAPVPSFLSEDPRLLVVGLAPGLRGANSSGRPFTGDYAGDLLYATLIKYGFAQGSYGARADDGLTLVRTAITNAVRCVPPENKPTPAEAAACRPFLVAEMALFPSLRVVLCLGRISHEAVLRTLGRKLSEFPFGHGAVHHLDSGGRDSGLAIVDSYHCSRYNTNTGRLTTEMFEAVFEKIQGLVI
ncbi:uracil-DNA glycosylase [Govanella unica]|uniref:Type-5 uracil-DNA glycosylase n=1 Tax=Govanella unica TaxID=2975056 RepID=A0A9X3TZ16_9PROT|nr:uracil-DNA glycosylase [Govania unica]MDA5194258.1 uracil-DNA glycosylase [Govania unica]